MLNRRDILKSGTACAAASLVLPRFAFAEEASFAPAPGKWREFEITKQIDIPSSGGKVQAWIPLPSLTEGEWIKAGDNSWETNAAKAEVVSDPKYGAKMLHVVFKDGETALGINLKSRFSVQDRADLAAKRDVTPLSAEERALNLEATELMPLDGIVKETADKIVAGKATDAEKAQAVFDWVVANTFRNPQTRGCGTGDVASMLKSGNLSGKCADLNALNVALLRAAGLPARDVYGIRVAPSRFGYKSLGAGSATITKAQHCRSEVWLDGHGWVATDPADVRKVILEEPPGNNAADAPKVIAAKNGLFGSWEGNWLGYNVAHDVVLPGSTHKVAFLMYPQAEVAGALLDCLDPDNFKYTITSAELSA